MPFIIMNDKTFATRYCAQNSVSAADYEAAVLRAGLYPHARLIAPLVRFIWPDHFAADLDFVQKVGRLSRMRDFFHEAEEFVHHPANRGFWRTVMHVRVSARALRRVVRATLHVSGATPETEPDAPVTGSPFVAAQRASERPAADQAAERG